ncbi:hypothetical protein VPHF99_0145 [Vibrio phage F99]|nr:hypothetical protein MYOV085v1_p0005 [Vibrio phage 355E48.1]
MKDLLNTYKNIAAKKSDFVETNNTKTRKENVTDRDRKEVMQSGIMARYNFTM